MAKMANRVAIRDRHRSWFLERDVVSRYDQAYFDKWYRHPAHRVKSPAELRRQVEFVVRQAEWVLGRPIRSVLDVGFVQGCFAVHHSGTGLLPECFYVCC